MLNRQNVSTFKKTLYCFFPFRFKNVRPSRNASNFFQNLNKNLFASYLCGYFHCVTTDGDLEAVMTNIRWPPTSHFSTNGSFTLYEQSKNAGWGTFRAGSPFSSHSSHSPLRPLCKVTHFFFAQTISPNPQWEAARTLDFQRNHYIVLLVIFFTKAYALWALASWWGKLFKKSTITAPRNSANRNYHTDLTKCQPSSSENISSSKQNSLCREHQ